MNLLHQFGVRLGILLWFEDVWSGATVIYAGHHSRPLTTARSEIPLEDDAHELPAALKYPNGRGVYRDFMVLVALMALVWLHCTWYRRLTSMQAGQMLVSLSSPQKFYFSMALGLPRLWPKMALHHSPLTV